LVVEGIEKLYEQLRDIDPVLAKKLKKRDAQRILRGLEIYLSTGKKLSDLQEKGTVAADFTPLIFGLSLERELLYRLINERVDEMINEGLLAEVANLKIKGFSPNLNSLKTFGYKEIFEYLDDKLTYDQMIELIKQNTRRYAKRQMTWFGREKRIRWISLDENTDFERVAEEIIVEYNNMKSR